MTISIKEKKNFWNFVDLCNRFNENNFIIIRKFKSEFCSKIHEAVLIKKLSPKLNRLMFANGASYLLNIFYCNIFSFFFFDDVIIWN